MLAKYARVMVEILNNNRTFELMKVRWQTEVCLERICTVIW